LEELRAAFEDVRETPTGFTTVLPADPALLSRLGEFVGLERLCCPFLTFDLSIPERRGPAALRVHGAPGSQPFLRPVVFAGKPSPAPPSCTSARSCCSRHSSARRGRRRRAWARVSSAAAPRVSSTRPGSSCRRGVDGLHAGPLRLDLARGAAGRGLRVPDGRG